MTSTLLQPTSPSAPTSERRPRDRELVRYVGRHGVVAIEHLMDATEVGRTAAYRRVAACIEAGLLERLELLREEPSLLRATHEGLRYAGLGLKVAEVSPGAVGHWLRCATVAHRIEMHFGADRVLSERELAFAERIEERPIASAELAESGGRLTRHRPDLAVLADSGAIAVEVELTPKAPRRIEAILRGYSCASHLSEVHYLCAPGPTRRAVERAAAKTGAAKVVIAAVPR
jgi:hypothetical protein